jgi:cell division protein FtsA
MWLAGGIMRSQVLFREFRKTGMSNPLQRLRNFIFGQREQENGYYPGVDTISDDYMPDDDQRQLYTALDIGTAYAKAMIIEVQDDIGVVLGVGRHQQSYSHMSDGIVTDIPGVIANCNEALLQAEEAAGGQIAPNTVIGIAGELVKGSSITITKQRSHPTKPITPEELEGIISGAQQKLLKSAKERIAVETGYPNIEVRLTNAAIISVSIDGQSISNPIGFRGRHFTLTLFSAFAPLMQLGALETVAQGLDLTLVTIVAEPYALARCLSRNASADSGAIFIDIGGGTTDIALVRQGGIEETRMFALGGRTFTRRLAAHKGLSLKDAEKLKVNYSLGAVKGVERDEIQQIFASEVQTWMDSVELLIEELAKGELLPPAVYLVGGGSGLPDLSDKLESFSWTERLSFSHPPIIQTIQPGMVSSIADPNHLLKNAQDITPMALAYQAIDLQNEDSVLERALTQVIHTMHI